MAPDRSAARAISAPGEPPGSRVSTTSRPRARNRSASRRACVDLPLPSPPSRVMKPSGAVAHLPSLAMTFWPRSRAVSPTMMPAPSSARCHSVPHRHFFGRHERQFHDLQRPARDLQPGHFGALGHRRLERAVIGDLGHQLVRAVARHQQGDGTARGKAHAALRAAEHRGAAEFRVSANSFRCSKEWKPHSSSRLVSSSRSFSLLAPMTTAISAGCSGPPS